MRCLGIADCEAGGGRVWSVACGALITRLLALSFTRVWLGEVRFREVVGDRDISPTNVDIERRGSGT